MSLKLVISGCGKSSAALRPAPRLLSLSASQRGGTGFVAGGFLRLRAPWVAGLRLGAQRTFAHCSARLLAVAEASDHGKQRQTKKGQRMVGD